MSNSNDIIAPQAYVIIGYGVTGRALAAFFAVRGWPYAVVEDAAEVASAPGVFLGKAALHDEALCVDGARFAPEQVKGVFPSPGVPPAHPIVAWSVGHGVPVLSELDLAAQFLKGEFIGVTGTNGKSTTVKLTEALLRSAGFQASLYGNFGSPLVNAVSGPPQDFYVVEESSYQLELNQTIHHRYAICLNVTDDHFDRYDGIAPYAAAKERILLNARGDDVFAYNADDPHCARMAARARCRVLPYSLVNRFEEGGFVDGKDLVVKLSGAAFRFPLAACALKGLHNAENMLASLLVCLAIKSDAQAVAAYRETLATFEGLPHRVQKVLSRDGVDYYDDSKGTNVGAVVMALAGFEGNVILIAGGRDKMGDYTPLKGIVRAKVKKLVLIGEAKERIRDALFAATDVSLAADMREAVAIAKEAACPGDTVLLSPACSSFDQYKNYKERGLDFQKWVQA